MLQETLVILKPDALERKLSGEIISRFEKECLKILDLKYIKKASNEILIQHYPDSMALSIGKKAQKATPSIKDPQAHGNKVLGKLREYFSRGPIIAIIFQGEEAIKEVRRITGYTDPKTAEKGTIRRDLGADSIAKSTEEGRAVENMIHASGNPEEAKAEIKLWFSE